MKDAREAAMVGRRSDGTLTRRPLSPHLQVYDMMQMTSLLS
ncbi:MAG: succinate dehydrogenase, cytochrome b556 subunit, partial [Alphaproteobacteria bacterium]